MEKPCRLSLLGVKLDVITPDGVMEYIADCVTQRRRSIIANHNLHSLYLFQRSKDMRDYYDLADIIEIDSMPMIMWAKLMGHKVDRAHRCTYLDFREDFWHLVQSNNWRVYHIGGEPKNNPLSKAAILKRYPRVILDMHSGFFDMNGADNEALLADIAQKSPHIVLVGMGMPRQEMWIAQNLIKLPNCVILPIGAAFDYEAGVMFTPPRWAGRWGIEWLVRFLHEPRRLFSRYFFEPWFLIPAALRDILHRLGAKSNNAR